MKQLKFSVTKQRGVGSLFIAVILLVAATLIVLVSAKVGVQDQRIAANNYRYANAFANAEAGMDKMAAYLLDQGATFPTTTLINDTDDPYYITYLTTSPDSIDIVSRGFTDFSGAMSFGTGNHNGTADVVQKFGFASTFDGGIDAPLMASGTVPPTGTFQIVGNPNGAGTGVPIAVWTRSLVDINGTPDTCLYAEYLANGTPVLDANGIETCASNDCNCTGTVDGSISNATDGPGRDIVQQDPNFPDDLFEYVFLTPRVDYLKVRQTAEIIPASDCGTFDGDTHGFYWVDRDHPDDSSNNSCSLPTGKIGGNVGTVANGCGALCVVLLVGADVELKITGGSTSFYGILLAFDVPGNADDIDVHFSGNNVAYGAILVDGTLSVSNISGNFDLRYQREVFDQLSADLENKLLARVPGSWNDECDNDMLMDTSVMC